MQSIVLTIGFLFTLSSHSGIPVKVEKKAFKSAKKSWKNKSVSFEEFLLDDFNNNIIARHFYRIRDKETPLGILTINKAQGCHIEGCSADNGIIGSRYEEFWYAVVFNVDLKIIKVKVLNYDSDYGYEICSRNWLKQFRGFSGCELKYGSREVDAISGATVSGNSIIDDLNRLCFLLEYQLDKR